LEITEARCAQKRRKALPLFHPTLAGLRLADAQVIHQADMVAGIGVARRIDLKRTGRLATFGVAQIGCDNAKLPL
jgi:hypothetical protein